jgi:hypothetical protein
LAVAGYIVLRPKTAHTIAAPATLGSFTRQQADATAEQLKTQIVTAARGDVKNVVAAVYQRKTGTGGSPQIVVFRRQPGRQRLGQQPDRRVHD